MSELSTPTSPAAQTALSGMVHVIDREGRQHEVEWLPAQSLMEALRDHGLPVLASCGGKAACATCHVYLAPELVAALPPRGADEQDLLDGIEAYEALTSRLSCQLVRQPALDGAVVRLAPEEE